MITCAFVAQRAVDDDEVGRGSGRNDLACGGQTDQQPASACKQLFGHQNCERCADHASDDAHLLSGNAESVQLSMVTWPFREMPRPPGAAQSAYQITVRIEQTNGRHLNCGNILLASCLAQQANDTETEGDEVFWLSGMGGITISVSET
jgi:hypothetical protein